MLADANFLAHTSRCTEIGKVLRRDYGYDVVFAGDGKFMRLPRELGFETDYVYTMQGKSTLDLAKKAGYVNYRWWKGHCLKMIQSDLECLKRQKPDAVVGDMRWSARTSTEMAGIPYTAVTNAHWTNFFGCQIRAFLDHFTTRLFGRRLATKLVPTLRDWVGRYYVLPYVCFRKKHGLNTSGWRNFLSLTEGELTLLADIPEFGPTEDAPPGFRYVGPILWEPEMPIPEWYDRLNPDRPTLYFTMGSTGYPRFFHQAIKTFGDTKYQVLITTGGLPLRMDRVPSNCFIETFAPGRPIMEKSDVVVSHGGNGTIYQAITGSVPILGIPYHIDQQVNLQRVEDLGIGFMISEKKCTDSVLSGALQRLLDDPSYRARVGLLKPSVERHNGPALAAQYIHEFLAG